MSGEPVSHKRRVFTAGDPEPQGVRVRDCEGDLWEQHGEQSWYRLVPSVRLGPVGRAGPVWWRDVLQFAPLVEL